MVHRSWCGEAAVASLPADAGLLWGEQGLGSLRPPCPPSSHLGWGWETALPCLYPAQDTALAPAPCLQQPRAGVKPW